jgi:cytochrome d ubiquinol oxidase subunit I
MGFDHVVLSRLQFASTAGFHIIFPCLIIGLAFYLTALEILWLKTKQQIYRAQFEFWVKPFAAAFIVGVTTGVVLSYQLDTAFGGFYYKTLNILVPIRKIEFANALLVEAGFFGIMVWGWKKVGDRLHFLATLMVTAGVIASAACILARNSWMQTPDGFLLIDGQLMLDDWLSAVISPSFPYRFAHMLGAAFVSTAFFILGISAWFLLKQRHRTFAQFSLRASLLVILVLTPLQFFSGDLHGLNTKEHQPTKLAAMEALWDTMEGAPLVLFGVPDQKLEANRYAVEIPKLASLIITHELNGKLIGLKDVPREERPNVPIVFFSFRIMVGLGLAMLAVGVVGLLLWRKGYLYSSRWYLRVCCSMIPSGFLATIAGWCVSEAGRQPWVVYGLIKTAEVVVPMDASQVVQFLSSIAIAYALLFSGFVYYLCSVIKRGPAEREDLFAQKPLAELAG